jgi:hypothetical protein
MNRTIKSFFTTLTLIYVGLNAGIILFLIVSLTMIKDTECVYNTYDSLFIALCVMFSGIVITSKILIPNLIKNANKKELPEKLSVYQSRTIIALALFEGVALFSAVILLSSHNLLALPFTFLGLLMMFMHKPSKTKFKEEFSLTRTEESSIDDDNFKVFIPRTTN